MELCPVNSKNRQQVNDFIISHWFSTDMVIRGEIVDLAVADGFAVYDMEELIGLITYRISEEECEITSFDSLRENQGIGTSLINKVKEEALKHNCKKIKLITTNDNMNALRYYQKRGFDMVHLYPNALDISRQLKPSIPMIGDFGIPLKHEIEFEMIL
ncbi:GNAT family N-acetyltransferase [Anaerocolumna sedimenticola]|uniref:GNAT family N-acetyltransferase n=1 Tax=Anaerocolumna sedimenticola TaxID=2696063 RepID=A0A6P1TM98_9FIRM|nr:GNAT family N-acetyltransferase [Anaerocolumna sedimenticola]QHQ61427.1 GNAT family N-acetyltransferase [Anaerocolumna sedimenticola]